MQKSVKHLVTLAMFTTMALVIFVVEAQYSRSCSDSRHQAGTCTYYYAICLAEISGARCTCSFGSANFAGVIIYSGHWSAACIH